MEKEILEKYISAGKIASQVRQIAAKKAAVGAKLLDIAQSIENEIRKRGGEPAFPVNLSLNDIAAHYTPVRNDPIVLKEEDILKIDLGVHVDGYVCDTAFTVFFSDAHKDLAKASDTALNEAVKICKPGVKINEISAVIEESITSFGFRPIANLTGHGLERFGLHEQPQIPNVENDDDRELDEDMVVAIEPFATTGQGLVKDSGNAMIFSLLRKLSVRSIEARKIIEFSESLNNLPFAERWIPIDSSIKIRLAMRELVGRGILHEYPPLREIENGLVSQAEHTVIIKDTPIVTSL